MAVIETKKEARDPRAVLLMVGIIVGLLVVGGGIFLLLKPRAPKQVKLNEEQAKVAAESAPAPTTPLPPTTQAAQARDPGPTRVTLELKDVTADQAFQALAQQANVKIATPGSQQGGGGGVGGFIASLMSKRFSYSAKDKAFWSAFHDLCKESGLAPGMTWENRQQITVGKYSVQSGEDDDGSSADESLTFASYPMRAEGSSMVIVRDVVSRFNADLIGTKAPSRELTVMMTVLVEPKLNAYRIATGATIEIANDELGNSLGRPKSQWDDQNNGPAGNWRADVQARLNYPAKAGDRIAKLKGYASVYTAGKERTVSIKDPLKQRNVTETIDGQWIRLVELRKQGEGNYYGRFVGDASNPVLKDWETFSKVATLVGSTGKKFEHGGGGWGGGRPGSMEFQLYFNAPQGAGEPTELQITLPTQFREIRVPFDFTDLPLPH